MFIIELGTTLIEVGVIGEKACGTVVVYLILYSKTD